MTQTTNQKTLWDEMVGAAVAERERKLHGDFVVTRDSLEPELTPFGAIRWYLHPGIQRVNTHALYFLELELPAGSRSGRLNHQGGIVHFIVEGHGETDVSGDRQPWGPRDVIGVPPRPNGVSIQHFNTSGASARIVIAFPNFDSALGGELGVELKVTDPAPQWIQSQGGAR